jgi:signal recognition particle receptor subunit beta
MSLINYSQREISCKIVYYGCGLCGKTTNLKYIYSRIAAAARGQLISLATELDRTLFFDFMPLDLGTISGFKTRFHLYTVPGQVFYNASRKLVLKGVDGVIFVSDSQVERMDANVESLANLDLNLREHNLRLEDLPFVIQHNKRDLPNIMSVADMEARLNPRGLPYFEAVASQGIGVFDTLKSVSKMVLSNLARM